MPAKRLSSPLVEPLRFGLVGIANSAAGLAVIWLGLAVGLGDLPANVLGYAVGLTQGFILNRRWTFKQDDGAWRQQALRYVLAFLPAYGLNLLVIVSFVSAGVIANPVTHVIGLAAYTFVFYLLCARFVFKADEHGALGAARHPIASIALRDRWGPEISAALVLIGFYAYLRGLPITHDVVWQYWIARQLLHGAVLYTDILEINPPMWFWSALPLQALAELVDVPSKQVTVAAIFGLIGASLALLARLFSAEPPARRASILLLACVAMIVVPIGDFGQREHLALVGALPYVALAARRAEGRATSVAVAVLVGMLAAYGFSLKHYFAAVPLLLELWLVMYRRPVWRLIRPETIVLGAFAVLYAAAMWIVAPGFFANVVPMVDLAYGGYEVPFARQVLMLWVPAWIIGAFAILRVRKTVPPVVILSALAMLGFAFSYFAQQKGWPYHALPASGCVTFAAGLAIAFSHGERWKWARHPGLPMACVLPVVLALIGGPYSNPYEGQARQALTSARPGDPVVLFSVNPTLIWPMIDDASLTWPLRHFTFWMIPALAHAEGKVGPTGIPAAMLALERRIQRDTAEDLWCRPPELIVVDDTRYSASMRGIDFDILGFFRRDPSIDELMKHYRKSTVIDRLTVYEKSREPALPAGMKCRPVVASR